jgi:hypothetical protein
MKLTYSVITAVLALIAGTAIAKNVFSPVISEEQLRNVVLELEQDEFNLGKREAKNLIDLNLHIADDFGIKKRDSKNVFNAQLIFDEGSLFKRDAKNIFDASLIIDDANLERRDAKNVFGLNLAIDEAGLEKRDGNAKNVVNVHLIIDDDSSLAKRGIENIIQISIAVPESSEEYFTSLTSPMSLGYLIGNGEYTAESVEHVNDHNIDIKLKSDSHGCHQRKKKLNLKSLTEVLDTFKIKMFDPTIEAKDKFVNPEGELDATVLEPVKGDIATALVQRTDLSVFAKYLRESPELYRKCETPSTLNNENNDDLSKRQVIIFAPSNDALVKLDRKPWEFPEDIELARSEDEQDTMIARNIANFVQAHFVETENFNISLNSKSVEFKNFNGDVIILENLGEKFRVKLKGTDTWSDVESTEVLRNGALLTIGDSIIH